MQLNPYFVLLSFLSLASAVMIDWFPSSEGSADVFIEEYKPMPSFRNRRNSPKTPSLSPLQFAQRRMQKKSVKSAELISSYATRLPIVFVFLNDLREQAGIKDLTPLLYPVEDSLNGLNLTIRDVVSAARAYDLPRNMQDLLKELGDKALTIFDEFKEYIRTMVDFDPYSLKTTGQFDSFQTLTSALINHEIGFSYNFQSFKDAISENKFLEYSSLFITLKTNVKEFTDALTEWKAFMAPIKNAYDEEKEETLLDDFDIDLTAAGNDDYPPQAVGYENWQLMADFLITWQLHEELTDETYFLGLYIFRNFVSKTKEFENDKIYALLCLNLAAKFNEDKATSFKKIKNSVSLSLSLSEIKDAELKILAAIDYKLHYATPLEFLDEFIAIYKISSARLVAAAHYFAELSIQPFPNVPAKTLAAYGACLANYIDEGKIKWV